MQVLEHEHVEALREQGMVIIKAVQPMKEVLDTILTLPVTFALPADLLLTLTPPVPWQLPATQQQASSWAWEEFQCHLHQPEAHAPSHCHPPMDPAHRVPWLHVGAEQELPVVGAGPHTSPAGSGHQLPEWEPPTSEEKWPPSPLGESPTHWTHCRKYTCGGMARD